MTGIAIPKVNYNHAPDDGHNIFRERFAKQSDEEWCSLLIRSISEPQIDGIQFPSFPEEELQNRMHGNHGETALREAFRFFQFVKLNTYNSSGDMSTKTFLDFGCGWGRIIRPFLRDFELKNIYGFEPNFLYCTLARALNPYVTIFPGDFVPNQSLPGQFFDFMVGWSIFSHLSQTSAVLWLQEVARVVVPGGKCVFTTWGERFLSRLQNEAAAQSLGKEIHWYSAVCISAAGSLEERIAAYKRGEFVWFTNGKSTLYGEAFLGKAALLNLITQYSLPFQLENFDTSYLSQDAFVLRRL